MPPEQPVGPRGGRPRVPHYAVVKVMWHVLVTGCRWQNVPLEFGCSGRTAHRLQVWEEIGIWNRVHVQLLELLNQADELEHAVAIVDSVIVRGFGGAESTGPSPVDRRTLGSKHTLVVDRNGVPLTIRTVPATASDQTQLLPAVIDFPRVGGKRGRPREPPDEVYADRGYDSESTRALLAWLGIESRIAKRGKQHGSGLGKVRGVVARTIEQS